ncbi:hypothetical protein [Spirosoma panaciterrae]|uniref:hypothetical protein n=1 Tax=Spirosoma panaciterrae TaxID=496058 RepID=UPI000373684B|nr:hypothetical protein [Spirosoma panaciterrae]
MNFFRRLFNRAERAYLHYNIVAARPDLADKPFEQQLRSYILDTIQEHVDEAEPNLPKLVERALDYLETKPRGYYIAQYWLYREKYMKEAFDRADELSKNVNLRIENIQARSLAEKAVNMVTDSRNLDNRLN